MRGQHRRRARQHRESPVIGGRPARLKALWRLARKQHGTVSRRQLFELGLSADWIDYAVKDGRLAPIHRGIYFVGHGEITPKAKAMAAVLACGAGAAVSHRSAAYLHEFLPYPAQDHAVEVTVAGRALAQRKRIAVHRTAAFDRRDVRTLDGIPITSPARTLLDVAASAPAELDAAFDEAVFRKAVRAPQLQELIARSGRRPGVTALRDLVEAEVAGDRNRRAAEKRFRALIGAAKLPKPTPNARIGRFVVDFLWPEHRVVAELDGFATHGNRGSFEGDRVRDGDLQGLDYRVIRVTWRQLTGEPYAVVSRVAAVLALTGRRSSIR